MTSKERVLKREYDRGRLDALEVQEKSSGMTGTELNAADDRIPRFSEAVKQKNMLERKAGITDGFVCKTSAGRVVRLIQNYDSDTFTGEPESLSAQWGFVWSDDPQKAREFLALPTSPYRTGNCCMYHGRIYRSKVDNNYFSPGEMPGYWQTLGG